jgi:hypothetical protein
LGEIVLRGLFQDHGVRTFIFKRIFKHTLRLGINKKLGGEARVPKREVRLLPLVYGPKRVKIPVLDRNDYLISFLQAIQSLGPFLISE